MMKNFDKCQVFLIQVSNNLNVRQSLALNARGQWGEEDVAAFRAMS